MNRYVWPAEPGQGGSYPAVPALLRACRAPGGSCPSRMSDVAGLMLKTIQYTYGVIGAVESSTTSAMLLVPDGQPAQPSGGVLGAWGRRR